MARAVRRPKRQRVPISLTYSIVKALTLRLRIPNTSFFLITVTLSNVSGNRYDRRVGSDIKRFLKERTTGTTNGGVEMCEN